MPISNGFRLFLNKWVNIFTFSVLISNMLNIDKKQKLLRVLIIFSTVKGILRPISLKMTTPKVFL